MVSYEVSVSRILGGLQLLKAGDNAVDNAFLEFLCMKCFIFHLLLLLARSKDLRTVTKSEVDRSVDVKPSWRAAAFYFFVVVVMLVSLTSPSPSLSLSLSLSLTRFQFPGCLWVASLLTSEIGFLFERMIVGKASV